MSDTKWIDSFTRSLADITEPEKRSLIYMVLIGVINEYKNCKYDGMDGIEILNSFCIKCRDYPKFCVKSIQDLQNDI